MINIYTRLLFLVLAGLMLLSPSNCLISISTTDASRHVGEMGAAAPELMFSQWRGFVLNDSQSRTLRVSIESIRPMDPVDARKLLSSNMTLEEIRAEMMKNKGDVIHRGVLRIGDDVYRLDNITMIPKENITIVDADVNEVRFGSQAGNATSIVGHLNAAIARDDGSNVSQGILDMNSSDYRGKYKVLLDTDHSDKRHR